MIHSRKCLVIKTSSLGDVIHMLPALSDAQRVYPTIHVDWLVEEPFAEIPRWHTAVNQVIPVALRRWRKQVAQRQTWRDIAQLKQILQQQTYAQIIDSQGLVKSAWLGLWAKGERWGYDKQSIREPLASWFYHKRAHISYQQHAVTRNRLLMAQALGYSVEDLPLDYGLSQTSFAFASDNLPSPYIVVLHATSRANKEWGENQWQQLGQHVAAQGYHLLLPWGNPAEQQRAQRLAKVISQAHVLPRYGLTELAGILQHAQAVIGVDTGLMHLAVALAKPCLALYPSTSPALTGLLGNSYSTAPIQVLAGAQTQDTQSVIQQFMPYLK